MAEPADGLFGDQWHLLNVGQTGGQPGIDINVVDIWNDYTGAGIVVGVVDDGVQHAHPDLDGNYDTSRDYDAVTGGQDAAPTALSGSQQAHGTAVAGLIAAERDGVGVVGVAYGATLVGYRMSYDGVGPPRQEVDLLERQVEVDIANNSWSFTSPFADNFLRSYFSAHHAALVNGVSEGRDGLGTVFVFAAGNSRETGDNVNYHNLQNARETVAVAAVDHTGDVAYYSTPGAAILVGAPSSGAGVGIVTTDLSGAGAGYSAGDTTSVFGGTSAATPIVSGVVALILDANPSLGYRDVQEILAYSARPLDPLAANENGARNWNGGGLIVDHDVGFGLVDAHAAVRLAETWTVQSDRANEASVAGTVSPSVAIPDGGATQSTITVASDIQVDQVEVQLQVDHNRIGDLVVSLTSPEGTESILLDRPGKDPSNPNDSGLFRSDIDFNLTSTHHWGESGLGNWVLEVSDRSTGFSGTLVSWSLALYGDTPSTDDTYIYTDQYGFYSGAAYAARRILADDGGADTLNAAALTTDAQIDLRPGHISTLAGNTMEIEAGTRIEYGIGGDGNDRLSGNSADNRLEGGRGDDWLFGDEGNDSLIGGVGSDTLSGGAGIDTLEGRAGADFYMVNAGDGITRVNEYWGDSGESCIDTLVLNDVTSISNVDFDIVNSYLRIGLPDNEMVWGVLFFGHESRRFEAISLSQGDVYYLPREATGSGDNDIIFGDSDNNEIDGGAGNDWLSGSAGNDFLIGGEGDDTLSGGAGIDTLEGRAGADFYMVNAGDGITRVNEYWGDTEESYVDTLVLNDVASLSDIKFDIVNRYLRIDLPDNEVVWGVFFFSHESRRFETIQFGDEQVCQVPHGMAGGAESDVLFGDDADNILTGGGGADVVLAGGGDDVVNVADGDFVNVDGGDGFDLLQIEGEGLTLDLTEVGRVTDIEAVDLLGIGNRLIISSESLDASTSAKTLIVHGDSDDAIVTSDSWTLTGEEVIEGQSYTAYSQGDSHMLVDDEIDRTGIILT